MPEVDFAPWRTRVDAALASALPSADQSPQRLHGAMRHAALDGGKRMRPLLVYATGTAFGAEAAALDAPAVAVELIHAYSLVHDDLPAMDDDALRRGKPTVHVAFDEATAILAGDALQSLAFEVLAHAPVDAQRRVGMLAELARASGVAGMCGGQALDIDATGGAKITLAQLERLHAMKTGALLRASVRLGALASGVDAGTRARLDTFADALGLAFQVRDDLLDVEGDSASLGKTAGKDAAQGKSTFPALLGLDGTRDCLRRLTDTMREALAPFGGRTAALAARGRACLHRFLGTRRTQLQAALRVDRAAHALRVLSLARGVCGRVAGVRLDRRAFARFRGERGLRPGDQEPAVRTSGVQARGDRGDRRLFDRLVLAQGRRRLAVESCTARRLARRARSRGDRGGRL